MRTATIKTEEGAAAEVKVERKKVTPLVNQKTTKKRSEYNIPLSIFI